VNRVSLYAAIAISAIALGVFHYKVKPKPDTKTVQNYADVMRSQAEWRGQIAPDFELTLTDGQHFHLADVAGKKIVVLNFFATWCEPCREEMPELSRYYTKEKDQNFVLLGIDISEKPELVGDFLRELKVEFPAGIDQGSIQKQYNVQSFPTSVLIGVDGRVQLYETGAIANAEVAFDPLLIENRRKLQSGNVISGADYTREAMAHPALPALHPAHEMPIPAAAKLDERGARIAAAMDCPCGCDKKVATCTCATSRHIKTALAEEDFKKQPDAEIVKSLNKRFCQGPM
jgi:thiol-disulfide isomerase/thioredoxin